MEPTSTASIKTARGFLAALLAVNLYRAMTQSVTRRRGMELRPLHRPHMAGIARPLRRQQPCTQYVTGPNLNLVLPPHGAFPAPAQPAGGRLLSMGSHAPGAALVRRRSAVFGRGRTPHPQSVGGRRSERSPRLRHGPGL